MKQIYISYSFKNIIGILFLFISININAQSNNNLNLKGYVVDNKNNPIPLINIYLKEKPSVNTLSKENGSFELKIQDQKNYTLVIESELYNKLEKNLSNNNKQQSIDIGKLILTRKKTTNLKEVIISATLKPIEKSKSAVPVSVFKKSFFQSNPSSSLAEAIENINGIRPQVDCSVCNTTSVQINGLSGPYSMITIDGMPIMSGLGTVYGLSGIPKALIQRMEVVKGPSSTLYGSESLGGLLNLITKDSKSSPQLFIDSYATTWQEINTDIGTKIKISPKTTSLLGINYFNAKKRIDNNDDNFMDTTLEDRISIFNKWEFKRNHNRIFSIAGRYIYEDRYGGEMNWNKSHRGGNEVYGESIYTSRWETFGTYQLPTQKRILLQFSANNHDQNAYYGDTFYDAQQFIGFGQLTWDIKPMKGHDLLLGTSLRYTHYEDNTAATAQQNAQMYLPGIFVQDQWDINKQHQILTGIRYDYNSIHGNIFTPRINYKFNNKDQTSIFRLGLSTGYRVVNVFTEDHAALTGAREVVFLENLNPEQSYNATVNYTQSIFSSNGLDLDIDATAFYTYFTNKIIPDYESDSNEIQYKNLDGYGVSNGISLNLNAQYKNLQVLLGSTLMDVYNVENNTRERQLFTERFTTTWTIGYNFRNLGLKVDYTGNLYSPMRLPLISELDPRPAYSPWWSIQNIQLTKRFKKGIEIYTGVKNLLNWTPWKNLSQDAGMITRPNDPFDKQVQFDQSGEVIATTDNSYAYTFDPTYSYASNQGIRGFLGIRYTLK